MCSSEFPSLSRKRSQMQDATGQRRSCFWWSWSWSWVQPGPKLIFITVCHTVVVSMQTVRLPFSRSAPEAQQEGQER
jgi:hypothetical protein